MAANDQMDIEVAEQKLQSMDHAEQHYFNRYEHHLLVLQVETDRKLT